MKKIIYYLCIFSCLFLTKGIYSSDNEQSLHNLINEFIDHEGLFIHSLKILPEYIQKGDIKSIKEIWSENKNTSIIQKKVYKYRDNRKSKLELIGKLGGGIWIPFNNLSLIGLHPGIILNLGIKWNILELFFDINFKFLNTPENYEVYEDGLYYRTNHFLG